MLYRNFRSYKAFPIAVWNKMHFMPLVLFFVTAVVQVHEALENKAVLVGEKTQMICAQNSEVTVFWFHTSPKDKMERVLFDGTKIMLTSFSNTNATGRMRGQNLKINPVQLENSGVFKCVVDSMEHSSQLIVLESKPVCGSSLNAVRRGFVDLWCQVNYTGFWPPRMQWMKGDRNLESKEHRLPTSLSTTLTVESESVGSNASYSCKLYFTAEDNTLKDENQIARNVPNFTFTFNSDAVYKSALNNDATTPHVPISSYELLAWLAVLAVLLFISVSVTISLALYFTVCRRKEPGIPLHHRPSEIDKNPTNASTANSTEIVSPEITGYEQVDVERFAGTAAEEEDTSEGTESAVNYSVLIRTEVTNPRTNYETINLSSTELTPSSHQRSSTDAEERTVEYVNILRR